MWVSALGVGVIGTLSQTTGIVDCPDEDANAAERTWWM
ncbi:MAG: hypothetical protein J07HX64_00911 [halophilic archaeon J07HX64]|nr:MAG: hypothetical protein J07HX64_00911 [halophilic archaeon J07HX64]